MPLLGYKTGCNLRGLTQMECATIREGRYTFGARGITHDLTRAFCHPNESFLLVFSFCAFGGACTPCFSLWFSCFSQRSQWTTATLVLMRDGCFLSFKWTDSTSLRLAKKDPFAAALLDETESSVGLSMEQPSSSEGMPFSASEVEESDKEEESNKQNTGKAEKWAQCDACDCLMHDGYIRLDWGRDGFYIEQPTGSVATT